jgi:hypothetical protein
LSIYIRRNCFALTALVLLFATQTKAQVHKKVLVEEFTGMWCGDCPMGRTAADHLDSAYGSSVICIGIHNDDSLSSSYSDQLSDDCGVTQFPIAFVDRRAYNPDGGVFQFIDAGRTAWDPAVNNALQDVPAFGITISSEFNASTRQLSASLQFTSESLFRGNTRINCVLVEDSIETDNQQVNFGNNHDNSPWNGQGNPIRHYIQRNTARINLSGNWGERNILPYKMNGGETFEKSYSYTLPPAWNPAHIRILAFVTSWNNDSYAPDTSNFSVLNAEIQNLTLERAVPVPPKDQTPALVTAFPNPFSTACQISFSTPAAGHVQILIYSLEGQLIAAPEDGLFAAGTHLTSWNGLTLSGSPASAGIYLLRLVSDQGQDSKLILRSN